MCQVGLQTFVVFKNCGLWTLGLIWSSVVLALEKVIFNSHDWLPLSPHFNHFFTFIFIWIYMYVVAFPVWVIYIITSEKKKKNKKKKKKKFYSESWLDSVLLANGIAQWQCSFFSGDLQAHSDTINFFCFYTFNKAMRFSKYSTLKYLNIVSSKAFACLRQE